MQVISPYYHYYYSIYYIYIAHYCTIHIFKTLESFVDVLQIFSLGKKTL